MPANVTQTCDRLVGGMDVTPHRTSAIRTYDKGYGHFTTPAMSSTY